MIFSNRQLQGRLFLLNFIGSVTVLIAVAFSGRFCFGQAQSEVTIGSKVFTESVILGDMLQALSEHAGAETVHKAELGGTQILWQALLKGDIDAYVEYSGTLKEEIFSTEKPSNLTEIADLAAKQKVKVSKPLGFNNTYALGMTEEKAEELNIKTITDLKAFPDLRIGFSDEFLERPDGWPGLKQKYELPQTSIRTMDHSLAYRGISEGSIDIIDIYSTDAEIISQNLRVIKDDLLYFPLYEAVIVYRQQLEESHPDVAAQFRKLPGKIDDATMAGLNKASRVDHQPEMDIAINFLHDRVDPSIVVPEGESEFARRANQVLVNTWQHIVLVLVSLSMAIVVSVPLGVLAYKQPAWGEWILGAVGIIQTIPSLALLVFMIPLLGLGEKPAILALFLYSLLPIVRGTHTGLKSLPSSIHESALALGLPGAARLRLIELPLAAQSILSGIKTSAVINVGTATIGALIGAGGYGQPILTGIRLDDISLILQGAIPAALLALLVQAGFGWIENALVPAGLRVSSKSA